MASLWRHSNLTLFKYNDEKPRPNQALSDWNRHIESPKCGYYINGVKLSDLRNGKPFFNPLYPEKNDDPNDTIEKFFKEQLFKNYNGDKKEELVKETLTQFHQTGLQHATNFNTKLLSTNSLKCSDP